MPQPDDLERALARYRSASDPGSKESAKMELMAQFVRPMLIRTVTEQLSVYGRREPDSVQDIASTAMLALFRRFSTGLLPERFGAYVQAVGRNAVRYSIRKNTGTRAMVSRAVVGAIGAMSDVSLSSGPGPRVVSLKSARRGTPAKVFDPDELLRLSYDQGLDLSSLTYDRLVRRALEHAGSDLPLSDIVTFVMHATGKLEGQLVSLSSGTEEGDDWTESLPASTPLPDETVELRGFLAATVDALKQLKPNYVRCLLLNFDEGLTPLREIFSDREDFRADLAQAMNVPLEQLNAMWAELPWTDARIAQWLGCREIDVSNYRMMARRKLKALLRAWIEEAAA